MVITAGASAAASANVVDRASLLEIERSQDELDELGTVLRRRMSELHALQDKFETAVNKQSKMLRSLHSNMSASANASVANADENGAESKEGAAEQPLTVAELTTHAAVLQRRLKEMQLLMPATGGMFVEMFLGSINVRFARKSERLAFKKEYEKLKLKLAPVFVVLCIICLVFKEYRWLHMVLQLALSCYYVTLAIRENILRANGSNIRAWWIIHHYFTMMQGVLLLTWPNSETYARYRQQLHLFGLYNAILQIFQTRYQMARLYTLRSLGRANEMDVASSDSTQIHWSETMRLLLPLILLGQFLQGKQAVHLFRIYKEFPTELQILLLSLLFLANFLGNIITTMKTLNAKRAASKQKNAEISSPYSSSSGAVSSKHRQETSSIDSTTTVDKKSL